MKTQSNRLASSAAGPYYPLGIIGTVPKAYDILRPTKEWEGEKCK
jgi:hypothetical protein